MKQIEQHINKLTDATELNRIGQQYANSGNYTVAMKAWLRAVSLGRKECRVNITNLLLSRYSPTNDENYRRAMELVKEWRREGDKQVQEIIDLHIELRTTQ